MDVKGVTKYNFNGVGKTASWFYDPRSCLCKKARWTPNVMHHEGVKHRKSIEGKYGCFLASNVIGQLFQLCEDGSDVQAVVGEHAVVVRNGSSVVSTEHSAVQTHLDDDSAGERSEDDDDELLDSDDDDENSGSGKIDLNNQWVGFKVHDCFVSPEVLECLLEAIQFIMGAPITLGLFPYFTHGKHDDLNNGNGVCIANFSTAGSTGVRSSGEDVD